MSDRTPILEAVILGAPRGKGRPRITRSGHVYTPPKTRSWESDAASIFRAAWGRPESLTGPLEVEVKAVKSRRKGDRIPGRFLRTVKPDVDNVVKAALDALQKSEVIKDDAHVSIVHAISLHTAEGEQPCVEVRVWKLESVECEEVAA